MNSFDRLYNEQGKIINELVKCFREHKNLTRDLAKKIDHFFRAVNNEPIEDNVKYLLISPLLPWLTAIMTNQSVKEYHENR